MKLKLIITQLSLVMSVNILPNSSRPFNVQCSPTNQAPETYYVSFYLIKATLELLCISVLDKAPSSTRYLLHKLQYA